MRSRRIEILFFDGCPNAELATTRAREAMRAEGLAADPVLVPVLGDDDATARRFLGSPTVRVDGADVEPSAALRTDFGLRCRVYPVGRELEGAPPTAWIAAALRGELAEVAPPAARGLPCPEDEPAA